ncbi:MAG: branched-chain amino acid transport system ATP-binding protein livM [Frankiales bacterium]|jgi:ABC-type branched-subunit amino acid transport system ATPase component/ABC-type branched-subunit amino acid transport system permease subunit|nr:branched-chain amino acid transport system ATP-binding protein livM [Frankiales bacterium]
MSVIEVASDLYLLLAVLGLAASVQYAGLPILGQGAFVAVGGFGTVLLAQHGMPLGIAVLLSVLIAGAAGYLLALGAARLSGAALALATWVLAWLVQAILIAFPSTFGGGQGLTRSTPTHLVSPWLGVTLTITPVAHLVIGALLCALALLALWRMDRGPVGLELAAMRSGPGLAASLGVPVGARRRSVLAVSASLGALGGAGGAVLLGTIAPTDVSPLLSLQLLVAVLLGGSLRPFGPVLGFAVVAALPHLADAIASGANVPQERMRGALTALLLVVALAARRPAGALLSPVISRLQLRRQPLPGTSTSDRALTRVVNTDGEPPLVARNLTVNFGAVHALDGLSLELRAGEVHAIVGPNGSGKTTLLRVLSGAMTPAAGEVRIDGTAVPSGQSTRVRAGVARTPQRTVLLPGMDSLSEVSVGARAAVRTPGAGTRHLAVTPQSRRDDEQLTAGASAALHLVGLSERSGLSTGSLGAGEQRLLQVARAAATGAHVLLLDEPAAGTTPAERRRLIAAIRNLADRGVAVCVVEHDMRFVGAVADRVTVLESGRVLASGDPATIRRNPEVRRAYLGDDVESA